MMTESDMNLILRLRPNLGHPNFPGNAEKTNEIRQRGWSQVEIKPREA